MATKLSLYPWQESVWSRLQAYQTQNRLPQALLLSGPKGIGKRRLVHYFARFILCENGNICGECGSCKLLAGDSHPDLQVIAPEPGKPITVDAMRVLIDGLSLRSQYGKGRIVIVDSADRMNIASANSFLKTLEEPGPDTHIVLICETSGLLPATIRSRCQQIKLIPPAEDIALAWLQDQGHELEAAKLALTLNHQAPLLAKSWLESDSPAKRQKFLRHWHALMESRLDPVLLAEQWKEESVEELLSWITVLTGDLVRMAFGLSDRIMNLDCQTLLQKYGKQLNLRKLMNYWQQLLETSQDCHSQANRQLMLEALFIATYRLTS